MPSTHRAEPVHCTDEVTGSGGGSKIEAMKRDNLRLKAARIVESALDAVSPEACIRRAVHRQDSNLLLADRVIDLAQFDRIILVGMGKASARMAVAMEGILQERLSEGIVVTADGYDVPGKCFQVIKAGHPTPDGRNVDAARRMADLADSAGARDLLVVLISGGGSALLTLPAEGIDLSDITVMNELLLRSGATIREVNTVRKHLSQIKGGLLGKRAYPAQVVALIMSDVPGDRLDTIASGPTTPDSTTFVDAKRILQNYGQWKMVPPSIRERIRSGIQGATPETPKPGDRSLLSAYSLIIGSGTKAALGAEAEAKRNGFNTLLLTTTMEGEARDVGRFLASIAREEVNHDRPIETPAVLIAAGETTVTVKSDGKGGRNQELALAAAIGIEGLSGVLIVSVATDGVDGPTIAAGGIVDGETVSRIRARGIDPRSALDSNDSHIALAAAGDLLETGPTGTNVADMCLVIANRG